MFPTLGVGLFDFKLNSSPRKELVSSPGLLLAHAWSAQCQSVPGAPNSRVSLGCPTPESPCSVQRVPGVPSPRVSLECPTPKSPWSAQPQSLPGVSLAVVVIRCWRGSFQLAASPRATTSPAIESLCDSRIRNVGAPHLRPTSSKMRKVPSESPMQHLLHRAPRSWSPTSRTPWRSIRTWPIRALEDLEELL